MANDDSRRPHSLQDSDLASLIIENAVEYAVFTLNQTGEITTWSPGAEKIFGYGRAEAIGMNFSILFTTPDRSAGTPEAEIEHARHVGRSEDSRWHLRKGGERFWANGVTMLMRPPADGLVKLTRDETPAKLAEERRVLLLNELNHRIRNTLVTVQSLVEQTLRANGVEAVTRDNLVDRLIALSQAHNVLVDENWAGADLHAIVENVLAPHQHAHSPAFAIDGPPVRISPPQAVAMALALHELATNALKYGALKSAQGRVALTWNLWQEVNGRRHLTLLWEERGGPVVAPPGRKGFGSRLIAKSFGRESGGRATLKFMPQGVQCLIELPLSGPAEIPMIDVAAENHSSEH